MSQPREIFPPRQQSSRERVAYSVTTTAWGGSPTGVVVVTLDMMAGGADVTATKTSGVAGVVGDVITTPLIVGLVAGRSYEVHIVFVTGVNTWDAYFVLYGVA